MNSKCHTMLTIKVRVENKFGISDGYYRRRSYNLNKYAIRIQRPHNS